MKKILVLGAGYFHKKIYSLLNEAGFYTIGIDKNPSAPAASYAKEFAPIDISSKEDVLSFASLKMIDGIMPINDHGIRSAAYVAEKMDLTGISQDTALKAVDKGFMRDAWKNDKLAQPEYRVVSTFDECIEFAGIIGYPCVIKPTDCGGSGRGISIANNINELEWSYNFASPYVKNNRFIIEDFLDGIEMTIESFSINGEVYILAMSDKYKPEMKTRVATSINYPANISDKILNQVRNLVSEAVKSIGIINGMAHTEVIVTDSGPQLVEIGARGGGGHIFHTIIELVSGFNAPVEFARLLVRESVVIRGLSNNGACYRFFNPPKGKLRDIKNIERIKNMNGIVDIDFYIKPGDTINALDNSLSRIGHVVTSGKTQNEAVSIANEVEQTIEFILVK